MAKTYEQKLKAYKATCLNHSQLQTVYVKYEINSGRPTEAGIAAKNAARWAFEAFPELRENGQSNNIQPTGPTQKRGKSSTTARATCA